MATLASGDFRLNVSLRWEKDEGVIYYLVFTWQDLPIINEDVLKRTNGWWGKGPKHGFFFSEYAELYPVQFFTQMLNATETDYLEPIDPNLRITIHPLHAFEEERSHVLWEAEHIKQERRNREQRKKILGKLPDDLFEIVFSVDTYNFKECSAYSRDGVSFNFLIYRTELEQFVDFLETERRQIIERSSTHH